MNDITAEYAVSEMVPETVLRLRLTLTLAAKTDLGRVREHNEDKFDFHMPTETAVLAARGAVFMVCDGMGGHAAGQIASEIAAKTFLDVYYRHPADDPAQAAYAGVAGANRLVLDVARMAPTRSGMGTTLTALALVQDRAIVAHVGDSRLYRLREGALDRLTDDHTWVEDAVRNGILTADEAAVHPRRNVLTRAIGIDAALEIDVASHAIEPGDLFLLCTDGLTGHVGEAMIAETLAGYDPAVAATRLISLALGGGGADNVTVLIVRVDAMTPA
jgi:protein phosphatase